MNIEQVIKRYVTSGMTAIDVGANVGLYTKVLSDEVGPSGHVFAIEPHPKFFQSLATLPTNVHPMRIGLGCRTGWRRVMEDPNNPGNAGITDADGFSVPILRLDDVFSHLPQLHFIKIDVEGMEMDVMSGGLELISRHRPAIVFETHDAFQYGRPVFSAIEEMLGRIGYGLFKFDGELTKTTSLDLDTDTLALPI